MSWPHELIKWELSVSLWNRPDSLLLPVKAHSIVTPISSMMGNAQHPFGVAFPAKLHLTISPSSSPSGQSDTPSHNLSRNIGRVNPNLSGNKQLVTGFEGFHSQRIRLGRCKCANKTTYDLNPCLGFVLRKVFTIHFIHLQRICCRH